MKSAINADAKHKKRQYFDRRAENYQVDSLKWPWGWLRNREALAVDKLMCGVAGLDVLDIGCGAGFYTRQFVDKRAKRIVAVDSSCAMINQFSDNRIEAKVGDAATMKIDGMFDRILCAGILEFVEDVAAVLKNARRHSENGGRLVVLMPLDNIFGAAYRFFHRRNGFEIRLFNRAELIEVSGASGWSLIEHTVVLPFTLVAAFEATWDNH